MVDLLIQLKTRLDIAVSTEPSSTDSHADGVFTTLNPLTLISVDPEIRRPVGRAYELFFANSSHESWPFPSINPFPLSERKLAFVMSLMEIM